jgi:hypothetical protein
VKDYLTFGLQLEDRSIGRVPNGTGPWQLTQPTLGTANETQPTALPVNLKINEWMAVPAQGDDWFELYNPEELPVDLSGLFLTDDLLNPTNSRIADLSFIGPRGYVEFKADQETGKGAHHVGFKLSANGDAIGLYATNGVTRLDAVAFGAQRTAVSEGRLPDGAPQIVAFAATASPGSINHLEPVDWRLTAVLDRGEGRLHIQAIGSVSGSLLLQGSEDCRSWHDLQTLPATGGPVEFVEALNAQSPAQYYYRAVFLPSW